MSKYVPRINVADLVAIDVHTHAEVSSRAPRDPCSMIFDEAMAKYFKEAGRPTVPQVAQYYRERKMAAVIFTVDSESEIGIWRIANEEVAELAAENADVLIPFASIDPARGKMGQREARRLIEEYGVRGFKFHPSSQGFYPNDRKKAYGLYEVIQHYKLPALFHTGQTGFGAGMKGGGGVRLKYSNPMHLDDVAVDFPKLKLVLAHGGRPLWMPTAVFLLRRFRHVSMDLSGIPPQKLLEYFPRLEELAGQALWGSDWPSPGVPGLRANVDRFLALPLSEESRRKILHENARRLYGL